MLRMRRMPSIPTVDPFLLSLVSVVALASFLPARGAAAAWFGGLADFAIVLLFFLHGAKLSRESILQGIGNWRLHLLTLSSTYVVFPAIGLAAAAAVQGWISPLLVSGLLFLTLLPSTVQSSIAFTAVAKGDVAAAVCSASLSNLLGIFLTPLLVGIFITVGAAGEGFDWHAVRNIVLQLLLPFVAGHVLRPVIGHWVDRHKKILTPVDRSSILLVVYSAFSAAVVEGIWTRVGPVDLVSLLLLSAVILGIVMAANLLMARVTSMPRKDFIVLLFCGSKKSLVSGVPMAGALFAPAQVGIIALPLMTCHQLQLFVCAWLAARFARQAAQTDGGAGPAPGWGDSSPTAEEIAAQADRVGIAIPQSSTAGVTRNLALLASHARSMRGGKDIGGK